MKQGARRAGARWVAICAAVLCAFAAAPVHAQAAPGDLDRSFGEEGFIDLTPSPAADGHGAVPVDLAVGPADEIFLVSKQSFACEDDDASSCSRAYVTKLGPNGVPDASFAAPADGVAEAPSSDVDDIVVDRLGRPTIVMSGDDSTVLARLLPNGSPDPSFGSGGTTPIDRAMSVSDMALAPDGSIVLAASVRQSNRDRFNLAFARLRTDGYLDTSFGVEGIVGIDLSHVDHAGGLAFVGGEIVATAAASGECCGELTVFRLLRLSASGQLVHISDPWSGRRQGAEWTADPDALLMERDGGLRLVGHEPDGMPLAGFRAGGRVDRGFGTRGFAFAPGFLRGGFDDATTDRGGRLVLGGTVPAVDRYENEIQWLAVTRRRPNGRLDRTFGAGNPLSIASPPVSEGLLRGMAVQSDGGIVLLGLSSVICVRVCPQTATTYSLARLIGGTSRARCHGRKATVVGTRQPEQIVGTPHRDVIAGLGGRDRVIGGGGADLICGGRGSDLLIGGRGNDYLLGGHGRDRLFGRGGNDRLHGGANRDLLVGGPGRRDRNAGGAGRDRVRP